MKKKIRIITMFKWKYDGTTRGIKHWGLGGYSNILLRIKFGVTGQDCSPQSPTISYRHPLCPSAETWSKIITYFCTSFLNNRYLQVLMSREGLLRSTIEKNISWPVVGSLVCHCLWNRRRHSGNPGSVHAESHNNWRTFSNLKQQLKSA